MEIDKIKEIRARCDEVSAQHADGIGTINAYQVVKNYIIDISAMLDALDDAVDIITAKDAEIARLAAQLKEASDVLEDTQARYTVEYIERKRQIARAQAFERALRGECKACSNIQSCKRLLVKGIDKLKCQGWKFDEPRFSVAQPEP